MKTVVIFGGTGFIGTHLAQHLLRRGTVESIVLVDLDPPRNAPYTAKLQEGLASGTVTYLQHDVRMPIPGNRLPSSVDLIVDLAAVHREPGHASREYFETNLQGADNVCAWAATTDCHRMVFTSSISPYGPSEDRKTEASIPVPETAYGASKLAAEKIHLAWQTAAPERRLLILRPGVVFGPGEGGNVSRMVRSIAKGYFFYAANRTTIKAATYVKELCLIVDFGLEFLDRTGERWLLVNVMMDPPPTMQQMVDGARNVLGVTRAPLSVPRGLLLGLAYPISAIARALQIKQPVDPVRVRKLFRSTYVAAEQLKTMGYRYTYTLESAFRDWKSDYPDEFKV